ncbi:MAG TPA: sugar-transfer associated ATP-grasp domain-containing protein [Thermoplasmata archaeon]
MRRARRSSRRPASRRASLRRHLPFLAFLVAFTGYCAFLQFYLTDALNRLYLVRTFFQVAIAAAVIASMRNVIGGRTLGMFGSVIIALAFLATGLFLGLLILGLILGVVLLVRGALIRERVQEAHRVAILVTIVGVTISSIAIIGLEWQQHDLFFAVLFPVLISAWFAERYVERVTRVGWDEPTKALIWTVIGIALSFFVITQDALVNFVMLTPLTWPLLVVINWFLGTQIRFRLLERYRFGGVSRYALADGPIRGDFGDDVLTMNVRNREFVAKYNPPETMARLGKDEAKRILIPMGVPMAKTYGILRTREDLGALRSWMESHDQFVLKPASGHGGEGIVLVRGKGADAFNTSLGPLTGRQIEAHALAILAGEYGGDHRDAAVLEELLERHEALRALSPIGLADVRVISFRGYPVMAMMRIPTQASGGKANLHLGALAAGVRLSTGTIVHCVWRGAPQPNHPDTGTPLLGQTVPFWDEILELAAEAQRLSGLGFAGVDISIDARQGPVVMEVNRRPGLEIQVANAAGLLRRLRLIEGLPDGHLPVEERLQVVREFDAGHWGVSPLASRRSGTPVDEPA